MEIRNCPKCKAVFTYAGYEICPACMKADEAVFEDVRLYLKEHPDNSLTVVAAETGVSAKKILRYVKEGRLEISHGMHGEVVCRKCGKPIKKGRYCEKCVIDVNQEVDGAFNRSAYVPEVAKTKSRGKMYTAERNAKK